MSTRVVDEQGVEMAGPDEPRLAGEGDAVFLGGAVGDVSPKQAGILPMGGVQISDAMVERALMAYDRSGPSGHTVDRAEMRRILAAAFRG